ncbi:MAG: PRC-barrel domain-containing protein [Xanthobacteraceae bacterium]|nr:PRC-barrel domain-containing protein [Xanthobacteraceae bacterium]
MRRCLVTSALLAAALFVIGAVGTVLPAHAASTQPQSREPAREEQLSPEETMRRRWPHPARVRDLIGLPLLDWRDNTLGYVQRIVRTPDGKIQFIVRYGGWFGWIGWWQRPVAVPIEVVALLGPHVTLVDIGPEDLRGAPTWQPSEGSVEIAADDVIRVALARR